MIRFLMAAALSLAALLCGADAWAQGRVKIEVGSVPSLSGGPIWIAKEKGYFDEVGLDVNIHPFTSSSGEVAALIATNQLQMVGGALSVGFFNSVDKGIPVKILLSRGTSPAYNILMLRPDLQATVKKAADLKGRPIAIVARGSIIVYQVGKILETGGLTLKDIEAKYMPFTDMAVALQNKAIDAALMIPPLSELVAEKGLAVKFIDSDDAIKVQPAMIAVKQVNTAWAEKNPKAVRDFVYAYERGVRDYCVAYHGGPNRAEIVKILAANTDVHDPALIEKMAWGSRDPYARLFEASLNDIQDFYLKEGLIARRFKMEELVATEYLDEANRKLGPFVLPVASAKAGCR